MIVLNFKTYSESTGDKALKLAQICKEVADQTGVPIIIGLQAVDIFRVSRSVSLPVFGQHLDPFEPGRNTGFIMAQSLKRAGASGVFLNHSEHPYKNLSLLEKGIKAAKENGLKTLVFTKDLEEAQKIDQFKPDYLALEEPSLVSSGKAMVEFPKLLEMLKNFSQEIEAIPLIGAGVSNKKDVLASLKFGLKGVVLSSAFVKSSDPKVFLESLVTCFK
ncbi:triose-phosphate isomerase [Candidatus Beckwithbacteria bacterium CG10_big_fil_rev_8_21_14_0_10_34_10]|uniref:Triose-phosphate isomerase n=1 Tax=Candidatus Beckwithbacteria bacterium CG10_big_fil_rev_8_21_14_0_10_34_10 TaxID=1974495 RepID=A0A2H0WAR3_9BACT|nr:MAG: triose-phosphate isomerase [Candidatus Beckwithbacteria bacterium CG10_big_fil_rev_8_21_14_0_10_34_10]